MCVLTSSQKDRWFFCPPLFSYTSPHSLSQLTLLKKKTSLPASPGLTPNSLATKTKYHFLLCVCSPACQIYPVRALASLHIRLACISAYPSLVSPPWESRYRDFLLLCNSSFLPPQKNPSSIAPPPVSLPLTPPRCFPLSRVLSHQERSFLPESLFALLL